MGVHPVWSYKTVSYRAAHTFITPRELYSYSRSLPHALPLHHHLSSSSGSPLSVAVSVTYLPLSRSDAQVISVCVCNVQPWVVCLTLLACTVVEVYERRDFDVEVDASISCATFSLRTSNVSVLSIIHMNLRCDLTLEHWYLFPLKSSVADSGEG